jgi:hypothetical protein
MISKSSRKAEDEAEVVTDRGENGIGGVTLATFEMASAEVSICLQMTDHGFDGRSAPELAFDDAEDAAFLPRDGGKAAEC